MEAIRDRIFFRLGTEEPIIPVAGEALSRLDVSMQWRKPLSIVEVNQMAQTEAVRLRPGRP
jgi:hypothetical protein